MILNFIKNNRHNLIQITIYNIILTISLYSLLYVLISPSLSAQLEISEIYWFNSIMIMVSMSITFILSSAIIHTEYRINKSIDFQKMISGSHKKIYLKNVTGITISIFFQILISLIFLLILVNPDLNYLVLPLYIIYLLLAVVFFINLGLITGFFTRKTTISIPGIVLMILILFLISGTILPFYRYVIIKYIPTSIIIFGGLKLLEANFTSLLIPMAYLIGLNIFITVITNAILNKSDY